MKKVFFVLLILCSSIQILSQNLIRGIVVTSNNIPLEGASVYINNSSIGTTTNENGEFELKLKDGTYDLIVSFLGFKTISYPLITGNISSTLKFKIIEDANLLDEIVIFNTKYDQEWKYNLQSFKRSFIGQTNLSRDCEILNPKVLHFEFDAKNIKLIAIAKEPLKIKHTGLGYLITYDLVSFIQQKNTITYLGYTKYENLKGGKRKQKKWKRNRLKAYNGSTIHFLKSLLNNNFKEEGFIINQFKRVENPERPSEDKIKRAREIIKLNSNSVDFSKNIKNPLTLLDSSLLIVRKARLPKFQDYLYKRNVPIEEIITKKNNITLLTFENCLSVIYTKEKEEEGFIYRNSFSKKRNSGPQSSALIMLNKYPTIDKTGTLINPLDIFYEGYWSYEKLGESLPLDYEPVK